MISRVYREFPRRSSAARSAFVFSPGLPALLRGPAPLRLGHRVAALTLGRVVFRLAITAATGLLTAVVRRVHRRPRAPLRLVLRDATALVALLDMRFLPLLLVGV